MSGAGIAGLRRSPNTKDSGPALIGNCARSLAAACPGVPNPPVERLGGVDSWQTRRPFGWGLLLLMDRDASDVPELTDTVVSQSAHGLAVKVLHAQDVDLRGFESDEVISPAKVQVDVLVGNRPRSEVLFSGVIDVPSGVLILGDAEHEDALEIGPGRWAVQVDWSPHEFAENVRVWLQPM